MTVQTKAKAGSANVALEREPIHQPMRHIPTDRAVAVGRDGKPIWRRMTARDDFYDTIANNAPHGWTYEWKTNTIHNMPDTVEQTKLAMGGWTPVPHDRHPGMFAPEGTPGPIIVGASILMERPEALTIEARQEERQARFAQAHAARAAHQLPSTQGLQNGGIAPAQQQTFVRESVTRESIPIE